MIGSCLHWLYGVLGWTRLECFEGLSCQLLALCYCIAFASFLHRFIALHLRFVCVNPDDEVVAVVGSDSSSDIDYWVLGTRPWFIYLFGYSKTADYVWMDWDLDWDLDWGFGWVNGRTDGRMDGWAGGRR